MKIRLYNARILTMERNREVFRGEVWVENNRIVRVAEAGEKDSAPREKSAGESWDREIDCRGDLLMPGFKDAHTHSAMTFLRSYADDVPLQEWLEKKVFPMEEKLTGEDIYHLTRLAVLEYFTSGITSVFEMYLVPDAAAGACADMGMRCVLTSGLNNFTSSVKRQEEEYLRWNAGNPLISYRMGFHSEYTCSGDLLKELAKLANRYGEPVFTHLAETEREVEECYGLLGDTLEYGRFSRW